MFQKKKISLILVSGGIGLRMGATTPKQYLPLGGVPIALHSFHLFSNMEEIDELVVVCEEKYQSLFTSSKPLFFAPPGKRRQDSVAQGAALTSQNTDLLIVHDAVRPFVKKDEVLALLEKALSIGAAALASPCTSTIKEVDENYLVQKTLDRTKIWAIQTPQ
ncbi:MAG: 2-C-methyl-D-erythritol 4-phosphate cytidylyltransferase, partial [Chlamydiia bacterium]|nr:2-C-methyl-D-erythritol 4-phosphate cytidylyltransferase [Chlamydiia bacterium]